jgi:hypothetical protein
MQQLSVCIQIPRKFVLFDGLGVEKKCAMNTLLMAYIKTLYLAAAQKLSYAKILKLIVKITSYML